MLLALAVPLAACGGESEPAEPEAPVVEEAPVEPTEAPQAPPTRPPNRDATRAAMSNLRETSEARQSPEPTALPCIEVAQAYVDQLVADLEVDGGVVATASGAVAVDVSESDEGDWYLVALRVDAPGMSGTELVWSTTADPRSANRAGLTYSTDAVSEEFSVYPAPDDVKSRFRSGDDRDAVLACLR